MQCRNLHIATQQKSYLFVECAKKRDKHLQAHPDSRLINLGIGDTTEPIPDSIVQALVQKAKELGRKDTYTGYGDPLGSVTLRETIAKKLYNNQVAATDLFISDGAKCDVGRLQMLFGEETAVAVQDPTYPAYLATSQMTGKHPIYKIPCTPDNDFFPHPDMLPPADLFYVCSPNNPTGTALTYGQLEGLVHYAEKKNAILLFDAAYSFFLQAPSLPRSIYEIEGAKKVAIEMGSFSKFAGFTGLRLGWTVVPKELTFLDGSPVQKDWIQVVTTFFNGASNLAQSGGIAALTDDGFSACQALCKKYLYNATLLQEAVTSKGYRCFGGKHAPYLWVDLNGKKSWDFFDFLLEKASLLVTPGVGFGACGEGFIRLSAFGKREEIKEAARRLTRVL